MIKTAILITPINPNITIMSLIWEAILANTHHQGIDFNTQSEAIVPLPNYSCIEVFGQDIEKFLQGQLSNDISNLKDNNWQLSAYCNQKGRIIALCWLGVSNDHYFLCLPTESKDLTLVELKKFGVFSKVSIQEANHLKIVGILGIITKEIAENAFLCMNLAGILPLSLLLFEEKNLDCLKDQSNLQPPQIWDYGNIINELPIIRDQQQEHFTPHQLNLQNKNVISLKKGCYRGQEIIARMHYLGKLKQSLYKIALESNTKISLPANLPINLVTENDLIIGEIVNLLEISNDHYLGLAVLNKSTIPDNKPVIIPLKNTQILRVIE